VLKSHKARATPCKGACHDWIARARFGEIPAVYAGSNVTSSGGMILERVEWRQQEVVRC
jgi:hypothetical protein